MEKFIKAEKQLVAEFFSNIGVAWFAAGVIGAVIREKKNIEDIVISLSWGLFLSSIFLLFAIISLRKKI